ncbi:MAG TPA: hydroxymethylbilane synthase [Polyangiales bacterium]|nr:hydroxymethylbilane synthase [Polyangiales bacterium]
MATRRSALALAQSRWVAAELERLEPGLTVELVEVVTQGDRIQNVSLSEIGGKGLFVTEVEQLLLDRKAELAVHSLKDVPAELAVGLVLGAVPEREDARDVLITADGSALDDLEVGARVGTNSLRRSLQLGRQRNDLQYKMLRGNVDTRLRKLADGEYDAIVLAAAGLRRLGLFDRPLWPMPVEVSVPAVGQGALAVEARGDDAQTLALLAKLDHAESRARVTAERAFLAALGGDCHTPLAGHARLLDSGKRLHFEGWVGAHDGGEQVRASSDIWLGPTTTLAPAALALAQEVAKTLLSRGAAELIAAAQRAFPAKSDPRSAPR